MDYEKLKELIAKQIKENGRGEITGPVLQAVLMAMVDSLGEVYPQTYTDEQKAQARANIDALSNYDGEITKEKLSAEVQAILDDVANKQNITDENLATIAKTIVGAINEVYKGGLEDGSIATSKIEYGAVTEPKIANKAVTEGKIKNEAVTEDKIKNYSISMSKLRKADLNYSPDLGSAVYHSLQINLARNGSGGSLILSCNGVSYTSMRDAAKVIEHVMRSTGIGVTLYISEPISSSSKKRYVGTVVGVSVISGSEEISAIIRDGYDTNYTYNKDYFVVIKDYKFTTKICLTDQLPKIASLETDVTSLLGKVEAKIKVLSSGTDLKKDVTEAGIYILSGTANYLNAPNNWEHYNAAILIVTGDNSNSYNRGKTILGFQTGSRYPFAATLRNNEWTETDLNTALKGKLDNTSTLTDTEINNIWDNN